MTEPKYRKIAETTLPNGMKVKYYCTVGGPPLSKVMEQVYQIAAQSIQTKLMA
ncbi:MAG: hypothetical protein K6T83_05820 [Alicyclobacillus sp.]|nr:hypothetical protein [Alicyclobacillus sp.]